MKIRKIVLIPAALAVFVLGIFASQLMAQQHQIRDARADLVKAQEHLMHAQGEFDGHKFKAMEHVKAAVIELDAALVANR